MNTKALLSLAKLGDHLGLASFCEAAAEVMVQMPWEDQIHELATVLQMSVYRLDLAKKNTLLHHAKRGAYTELQVLEVLEKAEASDDELMTCISLQALQLEEMQVLLRILRNSGHKPGAFLAKAVQQHTLPACLQPDGKAETTTRLVDHIMRSEVSNCEETYGLANTNFELQVEASPTSGKTGAVDKAHSHQSSMLQFCYCSDKCSLQAQATADANTMHVCRNIWHISWLSWRYSQTGACIYLV